MADKSTIRVSVVVPNWNGKGSLQACLDSLLAQSLKPNIIVVENGSVDGSLEFLQSNYPEVEVLAQSKNLGFAGGVNVGIKKSIELGNEFVALFNNDAVADTDWLKNLAKTLDGNKNAGIATCKFMTIDKKHLDSTGDLYTVWGLPFPRGRDEPVGTQYDNDKFVFAASGGASLYRIKMLQEIGLFDEDFFAYYEDVDLSFRAQLAGWKVLFEPSSEAYHQIGATSGRIKGFTTYQTFKNLPWLFLKNVPLKYFFKVGWRLRLAMIGFFVRAAMRGQFWPAFKGSWVSFFLTPKKLVERHKIQSNKKVSDEYIWSIMRHDLPPNAAALRKLRAKYQKLFGRG